jgi:glycosyltransferase involved in cell wall biosynthesis
VNGAPVTIGMPVYNGGAFLERALAGIRAQTHSDWLLIASDDGSTDESPAILARHAAADRRIRVVRQERNLGQLGNFGWLVERAETPLFMWHCQDDWMPPEYLATLAGILAADREAALACGAANRIGLEDTLIKHKRFPDLPPTRAGRVRTLLTQSEATRIFGLFRTDALRPAFAAARDVGYVWGWDPLALLPFILNDRLRGTNDTAFSWRDTGVSAASYRPVTLAAQLAFQQRWLSFHLRTLRGSRLRPIEQVLCLPALLAHLDERSGVSLYKTRVRPLLRRLIGPALPEPS